MKIKELQDKRCELAAKIRAHADKQDEWNDEDRQTWTALNADYDSNLVDLEKGKERIAVAARKAVLDQHDEDPATEVTPGREPYQAIGYDDPSLMRSPTSMPHNEWAYSSRGPINVWAFGQPGQPSIEEWHLGLQAWFRAVRDGQPRGAITDRHVAAAQRCGIPLGHNGINLRLSPGISRSQMGNPRAELSSQDGVAGGFSVGSTFIAALESAMLAFGNVMDAISVIRVATSESIHWPTMDDTTNQGRQIGESKPAVDLDPAFAQKDWHFYGFTSDEVKVPFRLLRDSAFNFATEIGEMLGIRLGRILSEKATTGTGAATIRGLVTAALAGITTASSNAIAFDETIDLEHSLDPSRRDRPGVGYMFHDNILLVLRKLKSGDGNYLWSQGTTAAAPDLLNNRPYTINQKMSDTVASGNVTALFGEFPQYKMYQTDTIRLYRLVERFRENDQDAFLAFTEAAGNLLDAGDGPVRKLTQV